MGRNTKHRAITETREALYDAGERLFAELGYAEAKVEAIARHAGFTRGAFYRHFSSKEAFFLELLERRSTRQQLDWDGLARLEPAQALEAIGVWYEANLHRQHGFDAAVQEFHAYASRHPHLLAKLRERESRLIGTLAEMFTPHAPHQRGELAILALALGEGLAIQFTLTPGQKAQFFKNALATLTTHVHVAVNPPDHGE